MPVPLNKVTRLGWFFSFFPREVIAEGMINDLRQKEQYLVSTDERVSKIAGYSE